MPSMAFVAICSCAFSLLLTPLVRNLFRRAGQVDRPDRGELQGSGVPRVGGIPLLLSYSAALALLPVAGTGAQGTLSVALRLAPATLTIFATGLVDDLFGLSPWHKLAGECVGIGMALAAGPRLESVGGCPLGPAAGTVLTAVWLLACTNAFNLIDGIDGLAAGAGVFAAGTILIESWSRGNYDLALLAAAFAAALLGFLRFNFEPASIFLGDSGSLTIGFVMGCLAVNQLRRLPTLPGVAAILIAFGLPLLDTVLAVVRRLLRGRPVFSRDRAHIHHKLIAKGLTARRAVLVLYAACALAAMGSLLASVSPGRFAFAILAAFCVAALGGVRGLGYGLGTGNRQTRGAQC